MPGNFVKFIDTSGFLMLYHEDALQQQKQLPFLHCHGWCFWNAWLLPCICTPAKAVCMRNLKGQSTVVGPQFLDMHAHLIVKGYLGRIDLATHGKPHAECAQASAHHEHIVGSCQIDRINACVRNIHLDVSTASWRETWAERQI